MDNLKVLEGDDYRLLFKRLFKKDRFYRGIDLNKFFLADIVRDFNSEDTISLYDNFFDKFKLCFEFLKIIAKILLYKSVLFYSFKGNTNIWFIVAPNKRPSLRTEIDKIVQALKQPKLVSWKYKFNALKIFENISRLNFYFSNLFSNYLEFLSLRDNILLSYNTLKLYDFEKNFDKLERPEAVFSFKDFQRFENGLMQIANLRLIPTFTSQHSVHHYFIGKNERVGNMMISNAVSKNFLCWGKFNMNIYKHFNPDSNVHLTQAYLRPEKKIINEISDKIPLIICLACNRRLPENISLLKLINSICKDLDEFEIIIRLHPSVDYNSYLKIIKKLELKFKYLLPLNKKKFAYEYSNNAIFITGLSGAYYDLLYLGFKTIFYRYPYELFEELPRAIEPFEDKEKLLKQLNSIKNLKQKEWIIKSKSVVNYTLNHNILEVKKNNFILDILDILDNKTK